MHLTAISQPAVLYSTSQPTLFFCSPHNEFNFNLNIPIWRSYCCVLPFVIHPFQQSKRKEKTCSAVSNMLTCQGCKLSYCAGTNNKILTLCRRDLALVWVKYSELYCGLDFFMSFSDSIHYHPPFKSCVSCAFHRQQCRYNNSSQQLRYYLSASWT